MTDDRLWAIRERMCDVLGCEHGLHPVGAAPWSSEVTPFELSQTEKGTIPSTGTDDSVVPWMLREWRRASIPEWQRILAAAREAGDDSRAEYARWMLSEVLQAEMNCPPGDDESEAI